MPFQPTILQSYQPNPCLNKLKKDLKQLSKEEVELLYKGMQTLHEANVYIFFSLKKFLKIFFFRLTKNVD